MKNTHKLNRIISLVVVVILSSTTAANAALLTDSIAEAFSAGD